MKWFTLISLILINSNLFSQNCIVNDWIKDEYFFDSQMLSIREIISDTNHPYRDSVFLPGVITDKYLGLLSAVYDQKTDLTDIIFSYYFIHIYPYFELDYKGIPYSQIVMKIDTTFNWVKTYIQDSLISGNHKFDSITSLYNLRLKSVTYLKTATYMHVGSPEIMNLQALKDIFESIEGIELAYPYDGLMGEGDDIQITFNYDTAHVVFSVGWGDCLAGCIDRHYWKFSVYNCNSKFERSYGDPLTIIIDTKSAEWFVFPNPFENKIFISNPMNETIKVFIHNIYGELFFSQQTKTDNINLSMLDTGTYFLTIESNKWIKTIKIIKR
jgi:hypothetical protein